MIKSLVLQKQLHLNETKKQKDTLPKGKKKKLMQKACNLRP